MFDSLHKAYLLTEAERTCFRLGIGYERIDRDNFKVDGKHFDNYKVMLSYVYEKDTKK